MDEDLAIALKECVEVLKDREWHDIYEFHDRFHLSAKQIYVAVGVLSRLQLIEREDHKLRFVESLGNVELAILNRLQKTARPTVLDCYVPEYLTKRKKSV